MNELKMLEEKLRESASIGDKDGIEECLCQGIDINSQNQMNGWTALHWSSRRGHPGITRLLVGKGADATVRTHKGELAIQLTDNEEIKTILSRVSGDDAVSTNSASSEPLPITASYLKYPAFPHGRSRAQKTGGYQSKANGPSSRPQAAEYEDELVLKVRVAESTEHDFIEIELPRNALTFENLVDVCCTELEVDPATILKIRKRPNTIVRKDKDVARLKDFQELELVVKRKAPFGMTDKYTTALPNILY